MEEHGNVNCSLLGYKCVSLQQGLMDIWLTPWCSLNMNISVLLWAYWYYVSGRQPTWKRGFCHWSLHFGHGNVLHYQQGLDHANWDGSVSVLILLYVQMKNVKMFMRLDSSINNIYNRNASCHFWCCIRIYLSFPSWYLPSPVSVV